MKFLELKIPPVVAFLTFAGIMWLVAFLTPMSNFSIPFRLSISLILIFAGGAFALAGIFAFRQAQTTVNPLKPESAVKIVTFGIYRFSRNPMYVGLLFVLVSWAVWLCNIFAFLLLPAFVLLMNRLQILPEERALHAKFSSEFDVYTKSVRRWL